MWSVAYRAVCLPLRIGLVFTQPRIFGFSGMISFRRLWISTSNDGGGVVIGLSRSEDIGKSERNRTANVASYVSLDEILPGTLSPRGGGGSWETLKAIMNNLCLRVAEYCRRHFLNCETVCVVRSISGRLFTFTDRPRIHATQDFWIFRNDFIPQTMNQHF